MSKVTKTILVLQSDSWIAAQLLRSLDFQPPSNRNKKQTRPRRINPRSCVTTLLTSPHQETRAELHERPVPAGGVRSLRFGVARVPRPDGSSSLKRDVSPSCPAVQTVSGCISCRHWPEVIATRRILPHCVGQERGGRAARRKKKKKED